MPKISNNFMMYVVPGAQNIIICWRFKGTIFKLEVQEGIGY